MDESVGIAVGVKGETKFKNSIRDINAQFKELASEMNLATSQFDKNDRSVEALAAQNGVLNKQIDAQKNKIETLRKALENASESFGENDSRTKAWRTQLNNAEAELNGMQRTLTSNNNAIKNAGDAFDDAEDDVRDFAKETEKAADNVERSGSRFEGLGNVLKGVGAAVAASVAAIGAAVGESVKKINDCVDVYANFDGSMRQVAATMGITADEIENGSEDFENLTKAAEAAGSTTKFSASEAADALNYLALAGYDAEKAAETLPKVLDLAAAGGMDLATTSDLVTDSMSALGMEIKDLDVFMDQMAKTSQKSNTSVQQLGEATLVCAGAVKGTGQDLNTMNTALGVLADNGIKGAEGGTHLRNVILSLSSPTDKAAEQLNALGVSVYDSQGNMRKLDDIMFDLNKSLGNLSQEAQVTAKSAIFNKTDLTAVGALLDATNGRFNELSEIIEDSTGAAKNMAETMSSGLAGASVTFGSALESVQIQVGKIFADLKEEAMNSASGIMQAFSQALGDADGDWGKIGDAVGEAISGVVTMISGYLPLVADIGINVITALVKGISDNKDSLAATAKDLVDKLSDALAEFLPQFADSAGGIISAVVGGIASNLSSITEAALQVITTIADGISNALPTLIPTAAEVLLSIVQAIIDNTDKLISAGLQIIEGLITGILDAIPKLTEKIPQIVTSIVNAITSSLKEILTVGKEIIQSLVSGLQTAIPDLLNMLPKIIETLIEAFTDSLPDIIELGASLITSLANGLAAALPELAKKIPGIIKAVAEAFTKNLQGILNAGSKILNELINGITAAIPQLVSMLPTIVQSVITGITENLPAILKLGMDLLISLVNGILAAIPQLIGMLPTIINSIVSTITENLPAIIELGIQLLLQLVDGIISAIPQLIEALPQITTSIVTAITESLPQLLELGIGLTLQLAMGLVEAIPQLIERLPEIIGAIVSGLSEAFPQMLDAGKNLITGLWEGIKSMGQWIADKVSEFFGGIVDGVKDLLGIHSPSTVFADIGDNMALGLGEGFEDAMSSVGKQIEQAVPTDFDFKANVNGMVGDMRAAAEMPRSSAQYNGMSAVQPAAEKSDETKPIVLNVYINNKLAQTTVVENYRPNEAVDLYVTNGKGG